jgi:osmotically-inducible protein OsmY
MKIATQFMRVAGLSIVPLMLGCQLMRSETAVEIPSVETPQEQALSKSVRARLLAHKSVDLSGVEVVSNGGTVYLHGTVNSLAARQEAIKLAWQVPGVESVVNSLEVQK